MWPNPQFPADLVTFAKEILNGKLHFLCGDFCTFDANSSLKVCGVLVDLLCGSFRRTAPFVEQFIILFNKTLLNRGQLIKRSSDIRY